MKWGKINLLIAFMATMLLLSGCVSQEPAVTPEPTVEPTAVPTVSQAPTQQPGISVDILNAPASAVLGKNFDVIWKVNSPVQKTIPHTAIHYGPVSQGEPLTLSSYPNLTTAQIGTIPSNFSAKMILNSTGTTYFRAHAIVDGIHYWSSERTISITGSPAEIKVTSVPKRPIENTDFSIKWEVSGGMEGTIEKTQILWDFKKGNGTNYSHNTTSFIGKTPMEFTAKMKLPTTSTIYFRAQAIVDGIEILSDEYQITIYPEYGTY